MKEDFWGERKMRGNNEERDNPLLLMEVERRLMNMNRRTKKGSWDWKEKKKREEQPELVFPLRIMNSCKNRKIWWCFPSRDTRIPWRFWRNRSGSASPAHITLCLLQTWFRSLEKPDRLPSAHPEPCPRRAPITHPGKDRPESSELVRDL